MMIKKHIILLVLIFMIVLSALILPSSSNNLQVESKMQSSIAIVSKKDILPLPSVAKPPLIIITPTVTYTPKRIIKKITTKEKIYSKKKIVVKSKKNTSSKKSSSYQTFKITAYDLSAESCGKNSNDDEFGITRYGIDLKGKNYKTARVISFDPNVIKPFSKVEIIFNDDYYKKYNGVYKAVDTGSGVKGKHFDLFLNCNGNGTESKEVDRFGVTYAKIRIIK